MALELTDEGCLPEGIHSATWEEVRRKFVVFHHSDRRFRIGEQLEKLIDAARKSGIVKRVIVGGSFVTTKAEPNDFDCILVLTPTIVGRTLRPIEYNLIARHVARRVFGGDVVPVLDGSPALHEYLEFFQTMRDGRRVGVVEIVL